MILEKKPARFACLPLLLALVFEFAQCATITNFAGLATQAQLNNVYPIARGPDGKLYLCDVDSARIRRNGSDGKIVTYAGSSTRGYQGDGGPATQAALDMPYEMAWDKAGNLYFVELGNHCVRRVDAKTQTIGTVAGNGKPGFAGDGGPAKKAQFNQPHSLAFDAPGDLYICDIARETTPDKHG